MKVHILTFSVLFALSAHAEMKAQEGLDQLKKNKEASQANLEQYLTNLKIVETNLDELVKAAQVLRGQEEQLKSASVAHEADSKRLAEAEKEYSRLLTEENKKKAADEANLAQLEKMKIALEAQIQTRAQNINAYQKDMAAVTEQKKDWQSKRADFQEADKKLKMEKVTLASQTKDQNDKKRGYEGEIARWKKEIDRQQKVIDGFQLD